MRVLCPDSLDRGYASRQPGTTNRPRHRRRPASPAGDAATAPVPSALNICLCAASRQALAPAKRKPLCRTAARMGESADIRRTKRFFRMMAQLLSSAIGQLFWWTVPFLLVLGVVVIVHELGHFLAARALGVTVEAFSVGFRPRNRGLLRQARHALAPGMDPARRLCEVQGRRNRCEPAVGRGARKAHPKPAAGQFPHIRTLAPCLIVLAGPFSNFLLSLVIFTGMVLATGIVYQQAQILCVEPGTPAAQAGLKAGDKILSVGGHAR